MRAIPVPQVEATRPPVAPAGEPDDSAYDVRLRIPAATLLKLLVAAGLAWVLIRLIPTLLLIVVSVLAAIALAPVVAWLERRRLSHGLAVGIVAAGVLVIIAVVIFVLLPPLAAQALDVGTHLPSYRRSVEQRLGGQWPVLARVVDQIFDLRNSPEVARSLKQPLAWGRLAVDGSIAVILGLFLAFYLLIDGKRTYAWLLAYVPRRHRPRFARTAPAVCEVVVAYMQGQLMTSAICGAYAFAALTLLRVPAALPLALLAAICDALPVLGVLISAVPAVLLGLTVSPLTAGAVLALYLLYHALENSVIIPRLYGKRLRLSSLAVLVALLIGVSLAGVLGPLLVLPLFAAYPIIEKIWLGDYLSDGVAEDHAAIEAAPAGEPDRAVEAVLNGRRPHA